MSTFLKSVLPCKADSCCKSLFCRRTQWNNTFFLVIQYAVERRAPAVQIKASLSWQTLEDFTLTVSLCVSQIQPGQIVKSCQLKGAAPKQNVLPEKKKRSTGTLTLPMVN